MYIGHEYEVLRSDKWSSYVTCGLIYHQNTTIICLFGFLITICETLNLSFNVRMEIVVCNYYNSIITVTICLIKRFKYILFFNRFLEMLLLNFMLKLIMPLSKTIITSEKIYLFC